MSSRVLLLFSLVTTTECFVLSTMATTRSHKLGAASSVTMGVQVKTITQAPAGAVKPKPGDIVLCHYTGFLRTKLGTRGKQFGRRKAHFTNALAQFVNALSLRGAVDVVSTTVAQTLLCGSDVPAFARARWRPAWHVGVRSCTNALRLACIHFSRRLRPFSEEALPLPSWSESRHQGVGCWHRQDASRRDGLTHRDV